MSIASVNAWFEPYASNQSKKTKINEIITQVNTNTGNITTNTSNIALKANTSQITYTTSIFNAGFELGNNNGWNVYAGATSGVQTSSVHTGTYSLYLSSGGAASQILVYPTNNITSITFWGYSSTTYTFYAYYSDGTSSNHAFVGSVGVYNQFTFTYFTAGKVLIYFTISASVGYVDDFALNTTGTVYLQDVLEALRIADSVITGSNGYTINQNTLSISSLQNIIPIGSANAVWVPLAVDVLGTAYNKAQYARTDGSTIRYGALFSSGIRFLLPYPTTRGGKNLHVSGVRVSIYLADASNYVDRIIADAATYSGSLKFLDDTTNRTSAGDYSYSITDTNVSSYDQVEVLLLSQNATDDYLAVKTVLIKIYYA